MKRIGLAAIMLVMSALLAGSAAAQSTGTGKVVWIVTGMFGDDKDGIKKYVNAESSLEVEFKPRAAELQAIQTKIDGIKNDLTKMQSNPNVPIDQKAALAKQDEGQKLAREFEFKQKEAQAAYAKRREEVLAPISNAIYQSLQDYAKKNGYSAVLDISALGSENQPSPIVYLDPTADITKEFIKYYNALTPGAATAAAPK